MIEDRLAHLAAGLDLREHLLREAGAERVLEARDDLHPLERIEAEFDDVGVEREAAGPLLGDATNMVEDGLHDLLRQFAVCPACARGLTDRALPCQPRLL